MQTPFVTNLSTGISRSLCQHPFDAEINRASHQRSQNLIETFDQENKSPQPVIRAHVHQRAHEGNQ